MRALEAQLKPIPIGAAPPPFDMGSDALIEVLVVDLRREMGAGIAMGMIPELVPDRRVRVHPIPPSPGLPSGHDHVGSIFDASAPRRELLHSRRAPVLEVMVGCERKT